MVPLDGYFVVKGGLRMVTLRVLFCVFEGFVEFQI